MWRRAVASPRWGDRSAGSTNGSFKGQQDGGAPGPGAADSEQTLADSEQTLADSEQTLADTDQTSSDSDQTSADCDQLASDRDQAASDRDLASGTDAEEHDVSRDIRQRATRQREQTAQARLNAAAQRDKIALDRDLVASARDRAADARDLGMRQLDAVSEQEAHVSMGTPATFVSRARGQRRLAAQMRAQVAEQRAMAARDRHAAAQDREQAARERLSALADREAFVRQVKLAETDSLTGARTRAAGLIDLDRELERCRRTRGRLVVAYVDVVGLKTLNDGEGHAAGDKLLKRVVESIKEHLRPYDLIIRLGGDEFLCAISNMTVADARQRFGKIAAALASVADVGAIRTGFGELTPDESAKELIARADGDMINSCHE